jgi:hypothetical protein
MGIAIGVAEVVQTEPVRQAVLDERSIKKADSSMDRGIPKAIPGRPTKSAVVSIESAAGLLGPTVVHSMSIPE